MKEALAVLAALFLAAPAPNEVTVTDSKGGLIDEFAMQRFRWEQSGTRVRIAGVCMSACTIYTGMKNVCLMPDAQILFHQGYERFPRELGYATFQMLNSMAPGLRAYVENYGEPLPSSKSNEYLVLEYEEAIETGLMEAC